MKSRIYIKSKHFLINFISITLILFVMILLFLFGIYHVSVDALGQEIKGISESTNTELLYRVEEILEQSNELATRIVVNDTVRLFYSHSKPEDLVDNYYNELKGILNAYGMGYIDSLILYSPKMEKIYDAKIGNRGATIAEITGREEGYDITWLDHLNKNKRTTTEVFTRAKSNVWPYYISLMKQYRAGNLEGVVLVNMNLQDLYDHLIAGRGSDLQLFLVDQEQRVIARSEKKELYCGIGDFDSLQLYRQGENFSEITEKEGKKFVYVQSYSEEYGITCVTVTAVNDYLDKITKMQRLFAGGVTLAVFIAIILAIIYSIRIEKPVQDIRVILENASNSTEADIRYGKNISDIADQIISYIQMNSGLRKEIDAKLDLLKDSQMVALQSQINPHFLFNTLNRISLMIDSGYSDRKCIVKMISDLSEILRYSLTEAKTTSIREEIQYIRKYLSIMWYRYGDFVVNVDVDEDLYKYAIPKLVLQPLVENALQHGISSLISVRECRLSISIKKILHRYADGEELESVCIEIEDNGIGIDEEGLLLLRKSIAEHSNISSEHIGVKNVAQRFFLLFHKEQEISLESTLGKGTCIKIIFTAVAFDEEKE